MNLPASNPHTTRLADQADQPFDPVLSRAMEEALKAPAAPANLASRIFSQTHYQLPRKIWGYSISYIALRRVRALAAGVVLAGSVGVFLAGSGILRDAHITAEARNDLTSLSQYTGMQTDLDQEIRQLAMHIDAASKANPSRDIAQAVYAMENLTITVPMPMGYYEELF